MDCDDATLLVAAGEARTLSDSEAGALHAHADHCDDCRALVAERAPSRRRWLVQVPEDALDDFDLLVLPVVDPSVFAAGGELARGGMGRVIRARDRRLGRDVAIKEVLAPALRARFEREVAITARLQHPAIIPVYEAGEWPNGAAFYTMRLVRGGTLGDAIAGTRTLEDRVALLPHVVALTDALAYAHDEQIVHRDLKPGNVLVGEFGETVVIDWGLAKEIGDGGGPNGAAQPSSLPPASPRASRATPTSLSPSADLTIDGSVMGTPGFMSPEQARGDDVDERADVYALGAILYNLLAGHAPYLDEHIASARLLMEVAAARAPTRLAALVPRAPADLCAIVERAMARDLAARYRTAKEMADELHRFSAGQLLRSREYRARELFARWLRRHRGAVAVAAVAAVVVAVGAIASVREIVRRRDAAVHALALGEVEQGRQLVVAGDPGRATPYLAAAVAALPDDGEARELATIALRDADRRIATLPGSTAAFSPDGRVLAVGHDDGTVDLVDAATGQLTRALGAAGGEVEHVDFAPTGDAVVTASSAGAYLRALDGAVTLLATGDVKDARFVGDRIALAVATGVRLVGRDGGVVAEDALAKPWALDVAPDGGSLLAISDANSVVWRLPGLTRAATLPPAWFGRIDRDGSVVISGNGGVRRYAVGTGSAGSADAPPVAIIRGDYYQSIVRLADGRLASSNQLIEADAMRPYTLDVAPVTAAGIDASHVITGGYDRRIRIWDLARASRPIAVFDASAGTAVLVVAAGGTRAASLPFHGAIELWNIASLHAPVTAAQLDDDPPWRILANGVGVAVGVVAHVRILDPGLHSIASVPGWPVAIRGDEVLVNTEGRYTGYDARTGAVRRVLDHGSHLDAADASASGGVLASCDAGAITVRDGRTGEVIAQYPTGTTDVTAIAVDDRGDVATGHGDGTVRIWDARGAAIAVATGHAARVNQLVIRGDRLLSGSWDESLRAWAWPSGESLGVVMTSAGYDLAVSPDGRRIVTAEHTAIVDVWDGERGRMLERVPTTEPIRSLTFVDDDHVLGVGAAGAIERIDLADQPRSDADIARLAAASRWQVVDGRVVERAPER